MHAAVPLARFSLSLSVSALKTTRRPIETEFESRQEQSRQGTRLKLRATATGRDVKVDVGCAVK